MTGQPYGWGQILFRGTGPLPLFPSTVAGAGYDSDVDKQQIEATLHCHASSN